MFLPDMGSLVMAAAFVREVATSSRLCQVTLGGADRTGDLAPVSPAVTAAGAIAAGASTACQAARIRRALWLPVFVVMRHLRQLGSAPEPCG